MKVTGQEHVQSLAIAIANVIDDEQENHALLALLVVLQAMLDQMLAHAETKPPPGVLILHSIVTDLTTSGMQAEMPFAKRPVQ